MRYDPLRHHRRSVRMRGYDYAAPGAYFVTVCTRGRLPFFDQPELRTCAEDCWCAIPDHTARVTLDEWVVMPNHMHGIIVINDLVNEDRGRGVQLNAPTVTTEDDASPINDTVDRDPANPFSEMSPRGNTLGVVVRTYKAAVTTAARKAGHWAFAWQRGYYEHIVRAPGELDAVRRYIRDNPDQWALDRDNPDNLLRLAGQASLQDYAREAADYGRSKA